MKSAVFFLFAMIAGVVKADLDAGASMQLTCETHANTCFNNESNIRYKTVEELAAAELSLEYLAKQEEEGGVRRKLRGSEQRELQNCAVWCAPGSPEIWLCYLYCKTRRELESGEGETCSKSVSLSDFLHDFPTHKIKKCLAGVECTLEWPC